MIGDIISQVVKEQKRNTRVRFDGFPRDVDVVRSRLEEIYRSLVHADITDVETLDHIGKAARWISEQDRKPMLLFHGGVGNGKTTLAKAIALLFDVEKQELTELARQACFEGRYDAQDSFLERKCRIPIFAMKSAMELVKMSLYDPDRFDSITGRRYLIIDDFGTEPVEVKYYGSVMMPMLEMLYQRYDTGLETVMTTNLSLEDIRKSYGERLYDRMLEVFDRVAFNNPSFRK